MPGAAVPVNTDWTAIERSTLPTCHAPCAYHQRKRRRFGERR
jgi:hypothetical protein